MWPCQLQSGAHVVSVPLVQQMLTGLIDSFRSFKPKRVNGLDLSYIPYTHKGPDGKEKPRRVIAMWYDSPLLSWLASCGQSS
jgi:hypothetical protein